MPLVVREEGEAVERAWCGWFVCGRKDVRRHLRPTLVFFLMSCATLIYANLDIVMLGFMSSPAEVGYYQVAAKVRVGLIAISGIVWNAALPQATQLWEQGKRDEFEGLARRTMALVCAVQAAVTVATLVLAEPAMALAAGRALSRVRRAASAPDTRLVAIPARRSGAGEARAVLRPGAEHDALAA